MVTAISIGFERHRGSRVIGGVVLLRQPSPDANRPIRATNSLQVLTPQQAQDRIALALARHAPTPAQTNRARSCCLCRHRHPPADHVRLQGVSANREAQHLGILFCPLLLVDCCYEAEVVLFGSNLAAARLELACWAMLVED